jgi:hypothetical protein
MATWFTKAIENMTSIYHEPIIERPEHPHGVAYIAFGDKARVAMQESWATVGKLQLGLPVTMMTGGGELSTAINLAIPVHEKDNAGLSRWAKVTLDLWTPFQRTLYLDADTKVLSPDFTAGFELLYNGWEMVMCMSDHQGKEAMWHIGEEEREATLDEIGFTPIQLQCGVMWFDQTPAVKQFFEAWRREWLRWRGQDQAAFLRALHTNPVKLAVLGKPFNSGEGTVIKHEFGRLRA